MLETEYREIMPWIYKFLKHVTFVTNLKLILNLTVFHRLEVKTKTKKYEEIDDQTDR